jgi:hypothetical protein
MLLWPTVWGPFPCICVQRKWTSKFKYPWLCCEDLKYNHCRRFRLRTFLFRYNMFCYGALLEAVGVVGRRVEGSRIQFPAGTMIFPSAVSSITALGPTHPPIRHLLSNISHVSGRSVMLPTHLQIRPMLRMHATLPPLLHSSWWSSTYVRQNFRCSTYKAMKAYRWCGDKIQRVLDLECRWRWHVFETPAWQASVPSPLDFVKLSELKKRTEIYLILFLYPSAYIRK